MTRRSIIFFVFIALFLAVTGAVLLGVFAVPYQYSRAWLNGLAKDGSLEMFSWQVYQTLHIPGAVIGILLWLGLGLAWWQRKKWIVGLEHSFSLPKILWLRLTLEWGEFWQAAQGLHLQRREYILLAILILLAIINRTVLIMHPMEHDEAYTIVVFAHSPLKEGLSDYHHPNNHLFHTLLAHFSIGIFGLEPWAARLPAFLAGILLIPVVYLFARVLYGRYVGLLASAFCAALPALVMMSVNARGYTLIMLLTVLILFIALYVIRRKSLLGWGLLVICAALGFYTIPIFLLSYGVMLAWVGLAVLLFDQQRGAYRSKLEFIIWLAISGVVTLLLTLLLYSPVVIRFGGFSILSRDIPDQMSLLSFSQELRSRLLDNTTSWLLYLPSWLGVFALLGAGLGLFVPSCAATDRQKMGRLLPYAGLISTALIVVVMRVNIYPRFMSFFIPLLMIWIAAGWIGLANWLLKSFRASAKLLEVFVQLSLVCIILVSGIKVLAHPEAGFDRPGDVEELALFLCDHLQENDLVIISPPHDAKLWYYSRLYGIDMDHYKRELPFFRAYIVVDAIASQTIESVLIERGPEMFFFDLSKASPVFQSGPITLFEIIPNLDLIRSEYHLP